MQTEPAKTPSKADDIPDNSERELLSPEHVEQIFSLTPRFLQERRSAGDGPPYQKIGRLVRYWRDEVRDWVRKSTEYVPG